MVANPPWGPKLVSSTLRASCQGDDLGLAKICDFDLESSDASRNPLCIADMQGSPLSVDHLLILGHYLLPCGG